MVAKNPERGLGESFVAAFQQCTDEQKMKAQIYKQRFNK